jgi:hypothetical protein
MAIHIKDAVSSISGSTSVYRSSVQNGRKDQSHIVILGEVARKEQSCVIQTLVGKLVAKGMIP